MSRECTCGGNPRCQFCGGLGEVPDRVAMALINHACRPESKKINLGAKRPRQEWISDQPKGATRRVVRRVAKKVAQNPASSKPPTPFSPKQNLVPCPIVGCSDRISPNKTRHLKKVHGIPQDLAKQLMKHQTSQVKPSTQTATVKRCSTNEPDIRAAVKDAVRNSIPDGLARQGGSSVSFNPGMDATASYARHYRDHGRFGSHPSHDSFDDESGPD